MINYNNKKFSPVSNSDNGEVDNETVFHYQQDGKHPFLQLSWQFYS